MKKVKRQKVQTFLLCAILSLSSVGCSAQTGKSPSMFAPIDSTMRAAVGDSISTLILNSKQITAERILVKNDSLFVSAKKKLKNEEASIVKFLFVTNEEFRDIPVVY